VLRSICFSHPLNPPTGIPVVEIVGSEWTDKKYVDLAVERYKSLGMHPIRLKKEVDGFVMNRMQYAVLASALSLVEDGIIEPEDVDLAMTSGLACRWSFMGPFQTSKYDQKRIKNCIKEVSKRLCLLTL